MENYHRKLVELISNLALEYKKEPAVVPYAAQKTRLMAKDTNRLARISPERAGIGASVITELFTRLEGEERANVHSIVVLKGGAVIAEAARPGFSANMPHLSHSMSKTVTGILILMLVDDKKLDTGATALSFFPEIKGADAKVATATVEHLLTMSSGASFAEAGVVSSVRWTEDFFTSKAAFEPGEKFSYNSMNSYILMHIADKITRAEYGKSAIEFLEEKLFMPLGITNAFWEIGPEGVAKGGWGLYMSAESWAKLGQMMLRYGVYGGKRIISEASVINAISTQSITPADVGDFNYGYQLWVSRDGDDFLFNGMLGQNVWVCPKNDIVVALNSGNNELFQKSPALKIIRETLGTDDLGKAKKTRRDTRALLDKTASFFHSRQWIIPHAPLRGISYLLKLKSATPFNAAFDSLIGEYDFAENNQGILPFFVRAMQNNYQGGISKMRFEKNGELLRLRSFEGESELIIDFGFYAPVTNSVDFDGEKYFVNAIADSLEDADGGIIFKLELLFPELPNTRRIIITQSPDGALGVKMREIPDERIADSFLEVLPTLSGKLGLLMTFLERNLGTNFVKTKMSEVFAPELVAVRLGAPRHDEIIEKVNIERENKVAASKLIRALINRFVVTEE